MHIHAYSFRTKLSHINRAIPYMYNYTDIHNLRHHILQNVLTIVIAGLPRNAQASTWSIPIEQSHAHTLIFWMKPVLINQVHS